MTIEMVTYQDMLNIGWTEPALSYYYPNLKRESVSGAVYERQGMTYQTYSSGGELYVRKVEPVREAVVSPIEPPSTNIVQAGFGGALVIGLLGFIIKGLSFAWRNKFWIGTGALIIDQIGPGLFLDAGEETERETLDFMQSVQDGLRDGTILNGVDAEGNPRRYLVIDMKVGRIWATDRYYSGKYVRATKKGLSKYWKDRMQSAQIKQLSERGT